MKDSYHFPLINPKRPFEFDLQHYLDHVKQEIEEYENETLIERRREEAVDILHAAETLVRHLFERTNGLKTFEQMREEVIAKNTVRGYYN